MSDLPARLQRRDFLRVGAIAAAASMLDVPLAESTELPSPSTARPRTVEQGTFELEETTIGALQSGMQLGRHSARSITESYLGRIGSIDKSGPAINSVIEVNPDAVRIAEERDAERK